MTHPGAHAFSRSHDLASQKYSPHQNWFAEEQALMVQMEAQNQQAESALETEPEGVDGLLVRQGFAASRAKGGDGGLVKDIKVSVKSGGVKKGYDLVRVGNVDSIAFFHHRRSLPPPPQRMALVSRTVEVLKEVSVVFEYNPCYVTLFYQAGSLSRFIHQQLMFNIWPIEKHAQENRIGDIRTDAFAYMYIYGLFIHKLAHFHDIVHGTRHDFYMDEIRIEFMLEWVKLLERKGFDPAQLETSELGLKFLRAVVF